MNEHDSAVFPEALLALVRCAAVTGLDLSRSAMALDSGFDSEENRRLLRRYRIRPVICPNRRNARDPIKIARMYRWFDRRTYQERFKVERTFAWQDAYRKLVVTFDRLPEVRRGCRLLAYSMINCRAVFAEGNSE